MPRVLPTAQVERIVPFLGAAGVGLRMAFGPGVPLGLVVAIVLIPLWLGAVRQYRVVTWWMLLGVLAVASGALLTFLDTYHPRNNTLLLSETFTMLALIGAVGVLLWARTLIGTGSTALAFSLGMLSSAVLGEGGTDNEWKYTWSVPVFFVVLSAGMLYKSRLLDLCLIALLALTTIITDSRSVTSFLLLAAALMVWQLRPAAARARTRTWQSLLGLGLAAVGAFYAFQSLILEGVFGEAAQQRSQAQIDTSGSLIAGGRPEIGAAVALILARPLGYGSGLIPTAEDVWVAKQGMSQLNYDPNNGYVEVFMFGGQFEVHGVLADLWIRFGVAGALFGVLSAVFVVYGLARLIAHRQASALIVFVSLFTLWNIFFSPLLGSYRMLALAVAMVAIPLLRSSPPGHVPAFEPAVRRRA